MFRRVVRRASANMFAEVQDKSVFGDALFFHILCSRKCQHVCTDVHRNVSTNVSTNVPTNVSTNVSTSVSTNVSTNAWIRD